MKIVYFGRAPLPDGVTLGVRGRWPDADIELLQNLQQLPAGLLNADALLVNLGEPDALAAVAAANGRPTVGIAPAGCDYLQELRALRDGADAVSREERPPLELPFLLDAVFRRCGAGHQEGPVECGALRYDPGSMSWSQRGQPLRLTPTESRLLLALAHKRGSVATRESLVRQIWRGVGDESNLRKTVQRLRDKGVQVATTPGVGYRVAA